MSEGKREFWFEYMSESKEYQQLSDKPPYVRDRSFELVHVIEKSAFDLAVKALKHYADRKTINSICNGTSDDYDEDENGFIHAGKLARKTLKDLGVEL